ncbi:MAG: SDR family oxidoreductase [Dehalococcoidia bacterium]|jgi:NAD(P)-dependent dehydrogenase (short-subunit alcohol dehydrogenase family)
MELGIKNKVAIITGGSRGIGKACAIQLAKEGVKICIASRSKNNLEKAMSEILKITPHAIYVEADLSTENGCKKVITNTLAKFKSIDILINNVGAANEENVLELKRATVEEATHLKTFSYLTMAQLSIPFMQTKQWGRIVNIAGGAGTSPNAFNLALSFANAAILNMTRALSNEVSGDNILVNVICPGVTNTDRARELIKGRMKPDENNIEKAIANLGKSLPAKRIAEPEEIAQVATFLSSNACTYVFGSSIYMDGGSRKATP